MSGSSSLDLLPCALNGMAIFNELYYRWQEVTFVPCYMQNISIGECSLVTFLDLFWLCLEAESSPKRDLKMATKKEQYTINICVHCVYTNIIKKK